MCTYDAREVPHLAIMCVIPNVTGKHPGCDKEEFGKTMMILQINQEFSLILYCFLSESVEQEKS